MAAVQRLEHPGWCRNILGAARVETGERVLVLVDEPLVEAGAQLLAAAKHAGAEPGVDLSDPARRLLAELQGTREVHVRGAAGTDLTLRVEGRPWLSDALPLGPGELANYPSGEVFVAPLADGADGVLVADLTVPYTGEGFVDEPVTLRFEAGHVTSIEGGR